MLQGISKFLTGDMLKSSVNMGHDDELVIADADFPAEMAVQCLIRIPGIAVGR